MIDIQEFEESVLIEANDFNWSVKNLITDISVRNKNLSKVELHKIACNIVGSLYIQELIKPVKSYYSDAEDGSFCHLKTEDLTDKELELLLKQPEQWLQLNIGSLTEVIELEITEKGRAKYLEKVAF